jgi:hypothetical protein
MNQTFRDLHVSLAHFDLSLGSRLKCMDRTGTWLAAKFALSNTPKLLSRTSTWMLTAGTARKFFSCSDFAALTRIDNAMDFFGTVSLSEIVSSKYDSKIHRARSKLIRVIDTRSRLANV